MGDKGENSRATVIDASVKKRSDQKFVVDPVITWLVVGIKRELDCEIAMVFPAPFFSHFPRLPERFVMYPLKGPGFISGE